MKKLMFCIIFLVRPLLECREPVKETNSKMWTPEYCKKLGYHSALLNCATCNVVFGSAEFKTIYDECMECCYDDRAPLQALPNVYTRVKFYLPQRTYEFVPTYRSLIDERLRPKYKNQIDIIFEETPPRFLLYKENDSVGDAFDASEWSVDTIFDFLADQLEVSTMLNGENSNDEL